MRALDPNFQTQFLEATVRILCPARWRVMLLKKCEAVLLFYMQKKCTCSVAHILELEKASGQYRAGEFRAAWLRRGCLREREG